MNPDKKTVQQIGIGAGVLAAAGALLVWLDKKFKIQDKLVKLFKK